MEDTLVTIIMPVYNAELYLRDAIESVLAQSYKKFIFMIINDGSTDQSFWNIKMRGFNIYPMKKI